MTLTKDIDELSAHEFMDRCWVIEHMVADYLGDHLVYHCDKYLKSRVDKISKLLVECYLYSGSINTKQEPQDKYPYVDI